jgi:hypothetical protein
MNVHQSNADSPLSETPKRRMCHFANFASNFNKSPSLVHSEKLLTQSDTYDQFLTLFDSKFGQVGFVINPATGDTQNLSTYIGVDQRSAYDGLSVSHAHASLVCELYNHCFVVEGWATVSPLRSSRLRSANYPSRGCYDLRLTPWSLAFRRRWCLLCWLRGLRRFRRLYRCSFAGRRFCRTVVVMVGRANGVDSRTASYG